MSISYKSSSETICNYFELLHGDDDTIDYYRFIRKIANPSVMKRFIEHATSVDGIKSKILMKILMKKKDYELFAMFKEYYSILGSNNNFILSSINLCIDYFLSLNDIADDLNKQKEHYHSIKPINDFMSIRENKLSILLKKFKDVTDSLNLKFYLEGGTQIGSVRHERIIPWDDDLDVTMFIDDINTLNEYLSMHDTGFYLMYFDTYGHFYKFTDVNIGVWVDIFPIESYDPECNMFIGHYINGKSNCFVKFLSNSHPNTINIGYVPYDVVFPLRESKLNGEKYYVVNQFQIYLRISYDNYMIIPNQTNPYHACQLIDNSDDKIALFRAIYSNFKSKQSIAICWIKRISSGEFIGSSTNRVEN